MKEIPEILEAAKLITRPLPARRGWVIRERLDGKWIDHPQVNWLQALTETRRRRAERAVRLALQSRALDDFEDAVLWAGEMAATPKADWRKAAKHVIDRLPPMPENHSRP